MPDGPVHALVVFNDGSGPALYAGGTFLRAAGVTVNRVAHWDGADWSALEGPGGIGADGTGASRVGALAIFDDGGGPAPFAGGDFGTAGGVTVEIHRALGRCHVVGIGRTERDGSQRR